MSFFFFSFSSLLGGGKQKGERQKKLDNKKEIEKLVKVGVDFSWSIS
jgi:hypothetical protein